MFLNICVLSLRITRVPLDVIRDPGVILRVIPRRRRCNHHMMITWIVRKTRMLDPRPWWLENQKPSLNVWRCWWTTRGRGLSHTPINNIALVFITRADTRKSSTFLPKRDKNNNQALDSLTHDEFQQRSVSSRIAVASSSWWHDLKSTQ